MPTEGNDILVGTSGPDSIDGLGGNDSIVGLAGNDTLLGGSGDDTVRGGDGVDSLVGGVGSDLLIGDGGADTLIGGDGADVLYNGAGDGMLIGGSGDDLLIMQTSGSVLAIGGDGSDTFWGSDAAGEAGFNQRSPGDWRGRTTIDGVDTREDLIVVNQNQRLARRQEYIDLDSDGQLDDALVLIDGSASNNNSPTITILNVIKFVRIGTERSDVFFSSPLDSTIRAGAGNDVLYGSIGDDLILGEDGADIILGSVGAGPGNDVYSGADTLEGGAGNDWIAANAGGSQAGLGGAGDDTISMGGFRTDIRGEDGADWLRPGFGHDQVSGGAGNDLVSGCLGFDTVTGDAGLDTLSFSGRSGTFSPASVTVSTALGYAEVRAFLVADPGFTRFDGFEVLELSPRDDIATSWINGPVIYGGGGNDWMADYASASNSAGAGNNDWMFGEDGDDGLYGLEGDDNLYGGMGRDVLVGGSGADRLSGDLGSDWIALGLNAAGTAGDGAADVVLFASRWDSWDPGRAAMDAVLQFETGLDRLDLSAIDADATLAGDQSFTLGALAAGQAGRLQITAPAGQSWTLVQADVDGDGAADLTVIVYGATGQANLTAGDFVL